MKRRDLEIRGRQVAVRESGGKGPPLVLCHGNSCSTRCFRKQLEGPLASRFHLIAFDWPGHGESAPAADPEETYTLPGFAEILEELAVRLGVPTAVFAGWSLGGHVVLEAADRLQHATGFVIFGTPPVGFPPAMDKAFLPNPNIGVMFQADPPTDEALGACIESWFVPGVPIPDLFMEDYRRADPRLRESLARHLAAGGYRDEVEVVGSLTTPLAVIHGAEERIVSREYLDYIPMPSLWREEVKEIPDAGHAVQWEAAAAFDRLVAEFVEECAS